MATSNVSSVIGTTTAPDPATKLAADAQASADRFLKLLVAQMQNQDPLNPMDNAQVTSQMAQINTVSGIEKLNLAVQALSDQFLQMQALQGAALVGRDVIVPGNAMSITDDVGQGGFELNTAADNVKVEILNGAGHVIDTLALGAQAAGRHSFNWLARGVPDSAGTRFRIVAAAGATVLPCTSLMRDTVTAVSANAAGNSLTIELTRNGPVAYSDIKAFN
ncbi:MAG: flagellar hook capping FlgD N-terminal domain-containing protein [Burkholderiaceae bacterium]